MLKKLLDKIKNIFSKEEFKKTRITEEMGVHNEWYERAREMDQENLDDFIDELINGYEHNYGTICHAIAAAGVAASYAIERSKAGGITGFQAGAVKWEYLRNWDTSLQDKPLRMVDYSNLLYPQYKRDFISIKKSTWEWVQKEARNRLEELPESEFGASENVIKHWEKIDDGEVPFGLEIID